MRKDIQNAYKTHSIIYKLVNYYNIIGEVIVNKISQYKYVIFLVEFKMIVYKKD